MRITSGSRVFVLASMLEMSGLAMATPVAVTNSGDSGPGTLRAAIELANADPSIESIRIDRAVGTIQLASTLHYTGSKSLAIKGNGAALEPDPLVSGFDILAVSGGGDLSLQQLTVRNGQNGVVVTVPATAQGVLTVVLDEVTIADNGLFGVLIDDNAGSAAGIALDVSASVVIGNGVVGISDFDGIRINETGFGSITARIRHSVFNYNGGDGIELDERGRGDVNVDVLQSRFNSNGYRDPLDLEDGLDIDEVGEGNIRMRAIDVSASDNFDEGIDLDEAGDGSIDVDLVGVSANHNTDEGIKFDEEDEGDVIAYFSNVLAADGLDDGIQIGEVGNGNVFVQVVNSTIARNAKAGIKVEQGDAGTGGLWFHHVHLIANGEPWSIDGVEIFTEP